MFEFQFWWDDGNSHFFVARTKANSINEARGQLPVMQTLGKLEWARLVMVRVRPAPAIVPHV